MSMMRLNTKNKGLAGRYRFGVYNGNQMTLTVTFDTNVFERLLNLDQDLPGAHGRILKAIKSGSIKGYFSDTFVTLEGVKKSSRRAVFGSRKIVCTSSPSPESPNTINLMVGATMNSTPIDDRHMASVEALLGLGISGMRGQAYLGDSFNAYSVLGFDIYEPIPLERLIDIRKLMAEIETSISRRNLKTGLNVGKCKARELGLSLLRERKEGIGRSLWYEGFSLESASKNKVEKAVSEWADGDSIISHIAHGHDYFCTSDKAKSASGPSIFDSAHRAWLASEHSVRFITPAELADLITSS
jgi:hypothetical protein